LRQRNAISLLHMTTSFGTRAPPAVGPRSPTSGIGELVADLGALSRELGKRALQSVALDTAGSGEHDERYGMWRIVT
jgi:hypothetical protein